MTFARTFRRGDRVQHVATGTRGYIARAPQGTGTGDAVVEWDGGRTAATSAAVLRHAPVTVIGTTRLAQAVQLARHACSQCGGALFVDPEAQRYTAADGRQSIPAVLVACSGCEYAQEVQ